MRLLLPGACALALAACTTPAAEPLSETAPAAVPVVAPAPATPGSAAGTATCTSPQGYEIDHPAGWVANDAGVLPACSWFGPAPFEVPEASDVRTAPITVEVLPVPLAEAGPIGEVRDQEAVRVDGRAAVRSELTAGPGLYPLGTPITSYAVELGGERTLVAEAVGLPGWDHARDVDVLDAMMRTLDLAGDARS